MNKLFLFFNDANNENVILDIISKYDGCSAECVLTPVNKILRCVRKLHFYSGLPGIGVWMRDWKEKLNEIDVCVCIASNYSPRILKWIKRKHMSIKCINYYWDVVSVSGYPVEDNELFENWSFNREDCNKYGMKYSPQFFAEDVRLNCNTLCYDITYVGADRNGRLKERAKLVSKYYRLFEESGIISFFYFVSNSDEVPQEIRKSELISEIEYYNICSKGRAILDLVESDIKWMTFRPLLALSNGIKLVTNNDNIVYEPFYRKENIFVLEKDEIGCLKEFIESDFLPYENGELDQYSVRNWCERFIC